MLPSLLDHLARGTFVIGRQRVLNDAGADFLHRDPFQFVVSLRRCTTLEPWECAAAQLLGAQGGYVDKQKPACNWRRLRWLGCVRLVLG